MVLEAWMKGQHEYTVRKYERTPCEFRQATSHCKIMVKCSRTSRHVNSEYLSVKFIRLHLRTEYVVISQLCCYSSDIFSVMSSRFQESSPP